MKILLFTDSLGAGGAQRQLVGLASLLAGNGYEIKVCTYHGHLDFYKHYLDENHIENVVIPGAADAKKRILTVSRFFKKEKADWIIAYQETPSLVACMAKVLGCKSKLMVSERNTTQKIGMNERVRFFLYRVADVIVPNCHAQADFLINHYPWMKKKIQVIVNFVDLDLFSYVAHTRTTNPEILVVASILPSKNVEGFLKACQLLKERGVSFHVSWYGIYDSRNEYYKKMVELLRTLKLENNVSLLPKTKEIIQKYRNAQYFCLPSFFEGTPNVICEAMSVGLPIICSDVCDNPYYVYEGQNGFLFNPCSPRDIANKLEDALGITEVEYKRYCNNSRHNAENSFSQSSFLDRYLSIINQ